jgi:HK97 gp10 family phage protein
MAGEEKAQQQLKNIRKSVADMSEAQLAVLKKMFEESQLLVPVDEGELKESGKYDSQKIEYGTDHAAHVEFGTANMKAQPYLRPAFENNRSELEKLSADIIQDKIKEAV